MATAASDPPMKITVIDNLPLVWSVSQVQALRKHRVSGVMDGALPEKPLQNKTRGLPMIVLKEAVTMLQEQGVVELVHYPALHSPPNDRMDLLQMALENGDKARQRNKYFEERKKQISKHSDKILSSARKKNAQLAADDPKKIPDAELTLDKVVNDKMASVPPPKPGSLLVQIHLEYPFINDLECEPAAWNFPKTPRQEMLFLVYKDLWAKKYWVVCGRDAGLDFLLYEGDPLLVHAVIGVTAVPSDIRTGEGAVKMTPSKEKFYSDDPGLGCQEMVAIVRLNTNQKRATWFAFVQDNGKISYTQFDWNGPHFGGVDLPS